LNIQERCGMATLNGVGRKAIDPGDLNTFDTAPRYKLIQGPTRLYRFGKPMGKWWFDVSLIDELREDFYDAVYGDVPREKDADGTRSARYGLAVSREWNKFARVATLTLKAGEDLDVFVGPTASQPEWQNLQDGPRLAGGMLQYVIYEINMVPASNFSEMLTSQLWKKWS
jgi:hypothetical protein